MRVRGVLLAALVAVSSACATSAPTAAPTSATSSPCVKTARGSAVARFKREHPCPDGPDAGSKSRCAGYHVHHVVPLMCGGPDDLDNLVWLTTAQHRALHSAMVCRCEVVRDRRVAPRAAPRMSE